jgi:hypothetical protein
VATIVNVLDVSFMGMLDSLDELHTEGIVA